MPSISALSLYSALGQRQGGASASLPVDAASALSGFGGGSQQGSTAEALANTLIAQAKAGFEAVLLSLPREGKVTLAFAGQKLSVSLPPEILSELAKNPSLLRIGAHIPVEIDAQNQSLRFLWPQIGAQAPAHQRATILHLSTTPKAAPVNAAAQNALQQTLPEFAYLASPNRFPPGSIANTIARLAGFSFPLLEASFLPQAGLAPETGAEPHLAARLTATNAAFRAALSPAALSAMPEGLAQEAIRSSIAQGGIGQAITTLLNYPLRGDAPEAPLLARLAGLRLDGKTKLDGAKIRDAVRASGVFLEADVAQRAARAGKGEGKGEGQNPLPLDLKALLLNLKAALAEHPLQEAQRGDAPPVNEGDAPPSPPQQRENTGFSRLVSGAIERIKLMQMASLPDHADIIHTDGVEQPLRLSLAIPIAIEGRENAATAMLGLVVEHRPPQAETFLSDEQPNHQAPEEQPYPWIVRLAFDTPDSGAVQAEIGLRGTAIRINLWIEREAMAIAAREEISTLYAALKDAAFEEVSLSIKEGAPAALATAHHPKLDHYT